MITPQLAFGLVIGLGVGLLLGHLWKLLRKLRSTWAANNQVGQSDEYSFKLHLPNDIAADGGVVTFRAEYSFDPAHAPHDPHVRLTSLSVIREDGSGEQLVEPPDPIHNPDFVVDGEHSGPGPGLSVQLNLLPFHYDHPPEGLIPEARYLVAHSPDGHFTNAKWTNDGHPNGNYRWRVIWRDGWLTLPDVFAYSEMPDLSGFSTKLMWDYRCADCGLYQVVLAPDEDAAHVQLCNNYRWSVSHKLNDEGVRPVLCPTCIAQHADIRIVRHRDGSSLEDTSTEDNQNVVESIRGPQGSEDVVVDVDALDVGCIDCNARYRFPFGTPVETMTKQLAKDGWVLVNEMLFRWRCNGAHSAGVSDAVSPKCMNGCVAEFDDTWHAVDGDPTRLLCGKCAGYFKTIMGLDD
jgi:hypothetical protein